jgi:glycosyltransferase involved in cell wall biosynthesis
LRYVAAASLALRRRPRLAYVSIGSPLDWLSNRRAVARYRLIARRFDFIIAVSERTKHQLVGALAISPSKVTVIASGVPDRLLDLPRQQHSGPIRVLFVGSLSEEKGPIEAVIAFGMAAEETDLNLRVVGDGPLLAAAQDAVLAMNIEERVQFAGSVEDITPHLAWADLLLLTSRTEGLPGVLIEAAASGVPAVAYDVGAVNEIVEDGSTGIVVHDRTVDVAARALTTLARDDDLRRTFGDRARAIAEDRFRIGSAVERTDRLLRDQLT